MKQEYYTNQPGLLEQTLEQIYQTSYFRTLDRKLLYKVCEKAVHLSIPEGKALIEQDTPNDYLVYILIEGEFGVYRDGNFIIKLKTPGQTIGEMAILSADNRSAEVRSHKDSHVLAIDASFIKKNDQESLELSNALLITITRILSEKLRITTERAKLYEDSVLENKVIEEYSQELKRDIQQKLEQIKLYSQVVESNQDAIIICNEKMEPQSANESFEKLFGYHKKQVSGLKLQQLFPDLYTSDELIQSIRRGWKGEKNAVTNLNKVFPAFISISPVSATEEKEGILAYAVEIRDITTRREYENNIVSKNQELQQTYQELENTVSELEKSNRIKDEFLSNMSYQFKTPLTRIINYVEILAKEAGKVSTQGKDYYFNEILQSSYKMEKMVANLLAMSELTTGLDSLSFTMFTVQSLFDSIYNHLPEYQNRLSCFLEHSLPKIFGDNGKLTTALVDIIYQTFQQLAKESIVEFCCRPGTQPNSLTFLIKTNIRDNVKYQKVDIPQSSISTVLSVSFETPDLNFPLARKIIKLHNGELEFSQSEQKNIISIHLPVSSEHTVFKPLQVMVIDENEHDRLIYCGILKDQFDQVNIFEAETQVSALNAINSVSPDLIIVDPFFKNKDWEDHIFLNKLISANSRKGSILTISSYVNDYELRYSIFELGITDFVYKPFSIAEVKFKLNSIVQMRQKVHILSTNVEKAEKSAITDGLTGLFNRKYFDKYAQDEFTKAELQGGKCSLIMLDVDNFKHYNDTNGHQLGDEVLKKVASIMKDRVRYTDMVARYGGEEFVVILPGTAKKMALIVAEKLREAIQTSEFPFGEKQPLGYLSASFGVSTFPDNGFTVETVLKGADNCLYEAKKAGRNRVVGAKDIISDE